MQKHKKDKHFLKKAFYPGGREALRAFIKKELRYPEEAREAGIEGTVQLRLTIDHLGMVQKVGIIKSLGYGCDEEAIRVVRMLRFTVPPPSSHQKVRMHFHKKLNIHFRLPKAAAQNVQRIQYAYTAGKSKTPASSQGYHYTISWSAGLEEE